VPPTGVLINKKTPIEVSGFNRSYQLLYSNWANSIALILIMNKNIQSVQFFVKQICENSISPIQGAHNIQIQKKRDSMRNNFIWVCT